MGIINFREEYLQILNMDEKEKTKGDEQFEEIQRIRMTLKGREVKPLEHACSEIVSRSKNKGYDVKGPNRIPTKILRVTVRKSPCGEGTNTWDRFEMRIHKRVIDLHSPSETVKQITSINIEPGVCVEVTIDN